MPKGVFVKQVGYGKNIGIVLSIAIGFFISIVNPLSWIVYFASRKISSFRGCSRNHTRFSSQWSAFLVAGSTIFLYGFVLYCFIG